MHPTPPSICQGRQGRVFRRFGGPEEEEGPSTASTLRTGATPRLDFLASRLLALTATQHQFLLRPSNHSYTLLLSIVGVWVADRMVDSPHFVSPVPCQSSAALPAFGRTRQGQRRDDRMHVFLFSPSHHASYDLCLQNSSCLPVLEGRHKLLESLWIAVSRAAFHVPTRSTLRNPHLDIHSHPWNTH